MMSSKPSNENEEERLAIRHRRFGWTSLFVWMIFGLTVEYLQGIKLSPYLLDPLRREFWTLAHFHGSLFAILNLVYVRWAESPDLGAERSRVSSALIAGSLLMPLGFLLGGAQHFEGDPGYGIFLTPVGALFLLYAVFRQVRGGWRR